MSDKLNRVEYPISASYCDSWGVVEALRELIANMFDAQAECSWEYRKGWAIFQDSGSGFDTSCLMFGEGESKTGQQIGQFREGLKLALLTLARRGLAAKLVTTKFSIEKIAMEMTGLGKPGLTLYVNPKSKFKGTRVEVQCKESEYAKACGLFMQMQAKRDPILANEDCEMYECGPQEKCGSIYVNGLLTDSSEAWNWVYNLRGLDIKDAINRDRSSLRRVSVDHHISTLFSSCDNEQATMKIAQALQAVPRCAEQTLLSRHCRHRKLTAAWQLTLEQLLGAPLNKAVLADGDMQAAHRCEDLGYTVVAPEKQLGLGLGELVRSHLKEARQKAGELDKQSRQRAQRKASKRRSVIGPFEVVAWEDVPRPALDLLNRAAALVYAVAAGFYDHKLQIGRNPEYFVYDVDHTGMATQGCAIEGKVGVALSHLLEDYQTEEIVAGTILHELTHLASRDNLDCTREFENGLTRLLGKLSGQLQAFLPVPQFDVTKALNSRLRVQSLHDVSDVLLTTEELMKLAEYVSTQGGFQEHHFKAGTEKQLVKSPGLVWAYYGAIHFNRWLTAQTVSNTQVSYVFLSKSATGSHQYLAEVKVLDTAGKRTNRRIVEISWCWNSRGSHYATEHTDMVTFKQTPFAHAWPEAENWRKEEKGRGTDRKRNGARTVRSTQPAA